MRVFMSLFMSMNYGIIITLLVVGVLHLYMLNVDDWMRWLHVLNYVVELLHAYEGENDGVYVVEYVHSMSYVHAS